MREDIKKYSDSAYALVEEISESIGSRLPGSEEEKRFAGIMEDKINKLGIKTKKEKFIVAPRASIGGIPYIGWAGLVACLFCYFEQTTFLAFAICLACWVFLFVQVMAYKGWFDFFFHQEMSQNVYGQLLPEDGKYDYTIMLSAHMDSSWNWKHSAQNPKTVYFKMIWGIIGMLFITCASLAMFIISVKASHGDYIFPVDILNHKNFFIAMKVLPVFCAPGIYYITMWCAKNKSVASPGAMDNLTGVAINYEIMKYFKENPDKMPANCRLIDMNFGSEEAGLKGSTAFVKQHKGEEILENLYNINVDSIADKDFFECIKGDAMQLTKFDKALQVMVLDSMNEAGIENPGCIMNPVGGCDSTPLAKAGVKSITVSAQDPRATEYYHTYRDEAARFDADVVNTGMDVILRVIDKISAAEEAKK